MMFGEVPLAQAEGAVLAHSVMLDGRRLPKGVVVDKAVVAAAAAAGLTQLWVARIEPGDVPEAQAAAAMGAILAGDGVEAGAPVHGRVNLHARHDGLLLLEPEAIAHANEQTADIGIATLSPNVPVLAGDLLATVKIIPFAMNGDDLRAVLAGRPALTVRPWRQIGPVLLLQTLLPDTPAKLVAKTAEVTRARLARFGWPMERAEPVPHAVAPLAAALAAGGQAHALILVAGAAATADRRDVVPAAMAAAGAEVVRVGMPVDPGNLLVLGAFGHGARVIGLPGCAKSPKRNGLDLLLEQYAATGDLSGVGMAGMGVGGLLDGSGAAVPWAWRP